MVNKKAFAKADFISVRDEESAKLLHEIGIKSEIEVSTDAVIGLSLHDKKSSSFILEKLNKKIEQDGFDGYFIYTVRPWEKISKNMYKILVQVVQRISQEYRLIPVLIPFQVIKENDQEVLSKFIEQKNNKFDLGAQNYTDDIFQLFQIFEHAKFTLGFRLHSLIFSFLTNTPCIAFSYSPKVERFMKQIGLEDFTFHPKKLNESELIKKISQILSNENEIKNKMKDKNTKLIQSWESFEEKLLAKM